MSTPPPILAEIAFGEFIDKITILQIKDERIAEESRLVNVRKELASLQATRESLPGSAELDDLATQLKTVNEAIWEIEDKVRDLERRKDFGEEFVEVARSVYKTNDKRAALKREINLRFGSAIIEEKSYEPYE